MAKDLSHRGPSTGPTEDVGADVAPGKRSLAEQVGQPQRLSSSVPGRSMRTDGLPATSLAVQRKARAETSNFDRIAKPSHNPPPRDFNLESAFGARRGVQCVLDRLRG